MSTARERVRQEAEEIFPVPDGFMIENLEEEQEAMRSAFIAGRTVSAEMIEQAAEAVNEELVARVDRGEMTIETDGPDPAELERALARAAFSAAGLIVEEEA